MLRGIKAKLADVRDGGQTTAQLRSTFANHQLPIPPPPPLPPPQPVRPLIPAPPPFPPPASTCIYPAIPKQSSQTRKPLAPWRTHMRLGQGAGDRRVQTVDWYYSGNPPHPIPTVVVMCIMLEFQSSTHASLYDFRSQMTATQNHRIQHHNTNTFRPHPIVLLLILIFDSDFGLCMCEHSISEIST